MADNKKTTSNKGASVKKNSTPKNAASKNTADTSSNVTKEFKTETKNVVKDVTKSIKNADIKKDTKGASNLVSSFLKNPIDTLKNLSDDSKNKHLIIAIVILAAWVAVLFITSMFGYRWTFATIGTRILKIITTIISPVISLASMSIILFVMQGSKKKSITTIFTVLAVAVSPIVLISILGIITLFASDFSRILIPISHVAQALTFVYMFFATKSVLDIDSDSQAMPKFLISQIIYFTVYFILTFLAISIPLI